MRRIGIAAKMHLHPTRHADQEQAHSSLPMQVAHVLTPIATIVTALAAFVACAAALNTTSVTVLAAAWVLAGWLARGRRCHCGKDRKQLRVHEVVEDPA